MENWDHSHIRVWELGLSQYGSTSTGQDFTKEQDVLFVSSDQYISFRSWMRIEDQRMRAILASDLPATRHALRKKFAHMRNAEIW